MKCIQMRNYYGLTKMAETSAFLLLKKRINISLISRRNMVLLGS